MRLPVLFGFHVYLEPLESLELPEWKSVGFLCVFVKGFLFEKGQDRPLSSPGVLSSQEPGQDKMRGPRRYLHSPLPSVQGLRAGCCICMLMLRPVPWIVTCSFLQDVIRVIYAALKPLSHGNETG